MLESTVTDQGSVGKKALRLVLRCAVFVAVALCALLWSTMRSTQASVPLPTGMGVATSGYVTTLFLEPITYENADYYYDQNNQLEYSNYIFHHGVDISGGCTAGSYPIYAAAAGVVAFAQYINDGYGTQVAIDHGWNVGGNGRYTYTFYGHMGNNSTGQRYIAVSPGQRVAAGQLIGWQGNDGNAFGSCQPNPGTHLDWEVRVSNVPLQYSTSMRYNGISASHNFYLGQQVTYGLSHPAGHLVFGPFNGGPPPPPVGTPTPVASPTPGPCGMDFSDLPSSNWAYSYVGYLYCNGVVSGYSDGTFRPDENTSRAEFTKWISLGLGWNLYDPYFPSFTDMPANNAYYKYIETAKLRSIIDGYSDGTFRPTAIINRAQAAKMLVIAKGWTLVNPPNPTFPDMPSDNWAYGYVETAVSHGIIGGYDDGTFRPSDPLTRALLSKMLALAMQQ